MKLRYSRQARADLRAIRSYITEKSPIAAERVMARLSEVIGKLVVNPSIGRDADREGLRIFSVRTYPYRIYYEVRRDEVRIVHIRHTARQEWTGKD
jgi:toxin ParE1/3/4